MRTSISARQIAHVISVICDAVHLLVVEEDAPGAIRRLEEALGGLHAELSHKGEVEGEGLGHALRAVKTLAHVLEALADERYDQAEVHMQSAVDAISAAVQRLTSAYDVEGSSPEGAVQLSVSEALRVPNEQAIGDALRNLTTRSEPEAFVIFVDAHTGKFVQFIGSRGRPLVLELPLSSLSEAETARAERFFEREGFADARSEESFSVPVGQDVSSGTSLAMGIFSDVLQSEKDFSLKIEEN